MPETSFSDNLFREEVKDDIVFDLDSTFQNQIKPPEPKKEAAPATGGGLDLSFLDKLPEIEGIDLGGADQQGQPTDPSREGGGFNLPGIDLNLPDIPKIDINLPSPDFQPAIDALGKALGKTAEVAGATVETAANPLLAGGEKAVGVLSDIGEFIGEKSQPISDVLVGVGETGSELINKTISEIKESLGGVDASFDDAQIRQGDGTKYGEVVIGDTGTVVDISKTIDKTVADLAKGTQLEGVTGQDIYNIATTPGTFIQEKGLEEGTRILNEKLGVDSSLAGDLAAVFESPEKYIKEKGRDAAINFIGKATGISGINSGTVKGVSEVLGAKDLESGVKAAGRTAATEATIRTVSTTANAIVPGSGVVIEGIARFTGYSCYLSTSAYNHGFIDKDDYLKFTKYRTRIQRHQLFSEQIWLGYIMLFEPLCTKLIHDIRFASRVYRFVTKPWLSHVNYTLGWGRFSLSGFFVDIGIKAACLVAYAFNNKKAKARKIKLREVNVMSVYKKIIRVVEKKRVNHAH